MVWLQISVLVYVLDGLMNVLLVRRKTSLVALSVKVSVMAAVFVRFVMNVRKDVVKPERNRVFFWKITGCRMAGWGSRRRKRLY